MNKILKEHFGYDKLKDKQEEIITSLLNGKDTVGILATGYGKSICYQLPFLITKKSVIVISPLISLMEDQFNKLKSLDIRVYCLNSNNSNKGFDKNDILSGKPGIVYMSPEYFFTCEDFIRDLSKKKLLSLIAVDESHCISTWSEFRPEYKELDIIKKWTKKVPVLALTATATPKIIQDIQDILLLKDPLIVKSSFHRENLNINVVRKYNKEYDFKEILELVKKLKGDDRAIIYCKTKDETDDFALRFKKYEIKAKSYHAGKTNKVRNTIQEKFTSGKVKIIIATIAFGMGVDIPNIRLIINYGISKDMESFYQEIGRAGRDGLPSDLYLYWSSGDLNINKSFLNNVEDIEFKKKQMQRILEMERFVNHIGCRTAYITNYFNEQIEDCGHCDNCLSNKIEVKTDITKECYYVLKTVKNLKHNFGTAMLCDILSGSESKRINDTIKNLPTYGSLKDVKKDRIKEIIRYLIINNYLIEEKIEKSFGSVVKVNKKGSEFISIKLEEIKNNIYDIIVKEKIETPKMNNKKLENKLKEYRKNKASVEGCKAYQVFPNKTIDALLNIRVKNINDLKKIDGLGDKRIEKYGDGLINILNDIPLEETKEQTVVDKLFSAGLSLDDIKLLKNEIIL
jgi:ATP-dependent DNA helicase RecQ